MTALERLAKTFRARAAEVRTAEARAKAWATMWESAASLVEKEIAEELMATVRAESSLRSESTPKTAYGFEEEFGERVEIEAAWREYHEAAARHSMKSAQAPAVNELGAPPVVHGPARELAFGKQLRRLREAANKSMGDLARHLGTSVTFISDVERGKIPVPFSTENIQKIADFLGVLRFELLGVAPHGFAEVRITEPPSVEATPRRPRAFVRGERVIVGKSTGVVEDQWGAKVHVKLDAQPNLILITRTENVLPHTGEPSTVSTEDVEVQSLDEMCGRPLRNWKLVGIVP
jgi:transcriptional regulator with XRE-family HTH domain